MQAYFWRGSVSGPWGSRDLVLVPFGVAAGRDEISAGNRLAATQKMESCIICDKPCRVLLLSRTDVAQRNPYTHLYFKWENILILDMVP